MIVYVTPNPPICVLPETFVSVGAVSPLKQFAPPPPAKVKLVRVVIELSDRAVDGGNQVEFRVPDEYFVHPKQGITKDGKVVMRINSQSNKMLDFEFDNLPSLPVKGLLGAIQVIRGRGP